MSEVTPVVVGDELVLKKPHACGANHWLVLRTGADLRLECAGCGRKLLLARARVEPQIRRFLARGPRARGRDTDHDGPAQAGPE